MWLAQTPQVFRRDWLADAYARRREFGPGITDDAQLVEALGQPVHVVEGEVTNLKITTRADLLLAGAVLKALPKPKVSGPVHPFDEGEMKLRLEDTDVSIVFRIAGKGKGSATFWTCDLTEDYIHINANYRT